MTNNPVLFDFSEFGVHACGRCTSECFAARMNCPYFEDEEYEILEAIIHSEMVYFVLPNYCDYPCANYFIFSERGQCFFHGRPDLPEVYLNIPKRSIVISSTNQEHFIQALTYQSNKEPEILFLSAKEYGKTSISGDLLTSNLDMTKGNAVRHRFITPAVSQPLPGGSPQWRKKRSGKCFLSIRISSVVSRIYPAAPVRNPVGPRRYRPRLAVDLYHSGEERRGHGGSRNKNQKRGAS